MTTVPCFRSILSLALAVGLVAPATATPSFIERGVKPSVADPAVKQFDDLNVVIRAKDGAADAPLVIFLPGTHGKPENDIDLLRVIAGQGYRVIGLEYDDAPAAVDVCPKNPDPDCFANFRQMRISGAGPGAPGILNPPAEAIEARLVAVLKLLDRADPGVGWGSYLDGDQPRWGSIVVSGLSQGAGMAAFIAKRHLVRRAVLFSSPWDFTYPGPHLAPWIRQPSVTPAARWFAEYHAREVTAKALAQSYRMLQIPADHVFVFNRDLPSKAAPNNRNPYHGSTVRNVDYASQWRELYGKASDPIG